MAILSLAGCDMKKNTWFNRKHQALNTKYNVYYNANESFKKGYKRIEEAYAPDYSQVIPVFAVSDPSTKGSGTGDMNKAVEKCEQAIQKRSMMKKPKKDYDKMRDPKYVAFYNQEEFNSYMDDVYMLMGKSKFHANDYLAASATFTYVTKHYTHDARLVTQANIWKARAMKEMDWIYEADEILKRIDVETLIEYRSCISQIGQRGEIILLHADVQYVASVKIQHPVYIIIIFVFKMFCDLLFYTFFLFICFLGFLFCFFLLFFRFLLFCFLQKTFFSHRYSSLSLVCIQETF